MNTAARMKRSAIVRTSRSPKVSFRRILLATDFSESSRQAVREAAALAREHHSQLTLVHVADRQLWQFAPPSTMEAIREQVWDAGTKSMEEWKRSAEMPRNIKTVVCEGDIPEEINKLARKMKADLVIIGTHGRQGLQQLMVGSIAQEVLRTVECPVMTIGPAITHAAENRKSVIVVATDFSPAAKKATAYAVALAKAMKSRLVVFRAFDDEDPTRETVLLRRLKATFEKHFPVRSMEVEYRISFSELTRSLLEASLHFGARYIVMGAKKGGAFLRTTTHWPKAMTYRVICGASAPVITVRQ
jgi:nucleotide-binding universal stress UspA family protein